MNALRSPIPDFERRCHLRRRMTKGQLVALIQGPPRAARLPSPPLRHVPVSFAVIAESGPVLSGLVGPVPAFYRLRTIGS